jgi:hypothetical protein
LIAWLGYINWCVGPVNHGVRNFAWPLVGLVNELTQCLGDLIQSGLPLNEYAFTSLIATIGLTVQAGFILSRPRPAESWWRVGGAYTLLLLALGPAVWEGFPIAASRVLLPLNLACNVLARRTRAPLIWLVACNLTIFSGLLAFRDGPRDPSIIACERTGRVAGVVRLANGWYGQEQDTHHRWAWAESDGHLTIATWPRTAAVETRVSLRLLSLMPRTVRVLTSGRELWRGPIGQALTTVILPPLQVTEGRLDLELATEEPYVPESTGPDARHLGFALYDPAISVSEEPTTPP